MGYLWKILASSREIFHYQFDYKIEVTLLS